MNQVSSIPVLDVPIYNGNIKSFFELLNQDILSGEKLNRQVSFCDANVLVSSMKNNQLKELLINDTYLNMPDGMPNVWMGKLKGARNIDRCYGPDVFEYILRNTADNKEVHHFFTGGKEGGAELLKGHCESEFNNHNIKGVHCPPFRELTEDEIKSIAQEINELETDIVWIGISSPKQDFYASRLRKYLNVHYVFTIGAAFDFYTGQVKQAPKIVQRSGFEWFYRILAEPKRMFKRYLSVVPSFIYYNFLDLFKNRSKPFNDEAVV